MPERIWKQCKVAGCAGLTKNRYCDKHTHLEEKHKKERASYYNKNIRSQENQAFYESRAWRILRRQKMRQMPLCEICYMAGRIHKATIVDHITEIKDGGAALDIENLQSVCHACHNKKTAQQRAKRKNGSDD